MCRCCRLSFWTFTLSTFWKIQLDSKAYLLFKLDCSLILAKTFNLVHKKINFLWDFKVRIYFSDIPYICIYTRSSLARKDLTFLKIIILNQRLCSVFHLWVVKLQIWEDSAPFFGKNKKNYRFSNYEKVL